MTSRGSDGPPVRPRAPPRSNGFPAPPARHAATVLIGALLTLAAAPLQAQSWKVEPAFSAQETLTNNVNLVSDENRRSDWVTQLTPSLRVTEKGARTSLIGFVSLPVLLYARTGSENNNVYPSADLLGDLALVENWLHVEGQVTVSQQYFNPFGGQPLGLDNATQNRYQSETYRITPYVKGVTPGNISYELRNNNVWTNVQNTPVNADDFRYTQFKGNAAQTETTTGWQADFDVNDVTINNRDKFRSRLIRLQPVFKVDPQLKLVGTVGYEENHFPTDESSNGIYGGAFDWRPTPRTTVTGSLEHRYFGPGYLFSFDHRTPLSVWTLRISRSTSSFPQQLANLPAGGDVSALLNNLFLTTIPDPALRQQAIDQFIRDRGLPSVLASPLNLYSQQVFLQESQTASVGLLGTRNTVVLTIFNIKSQPISASGDALTLPVNFGDNSRETGISLVWSHKLTPAVVIDATIERFRTIANQPLEGRTNQTALRVAVSTPLSAKTTMFGGARYQTLSSDVATNYNETAAFIGVTYTFH